MPPTPKHLLEALDFITADNEPKAAVESLHTTHVMRVRGTFDDPNIVGVGVSKKVTEGKELESLLTVYLSAYVITPKRLRKADR